MIETATPKVFPVVTIRLRNDHDVVMARQRARVIAATLGFDGQEQVRFATAVSEIARNAHRYATGGQVSFSIASARDGMSPCADSRRSIGKFGKSWWLMVRVSDRGHGIPQLDKVLDGSYVSSTGMGLGIIGARRLVGCFHLESSSDNGTTVELGTELPHRSDDFTGVDAGKLATAIAATPASGPLEELERQNQEILATMEMLRERQLSIERLNTELAETNRGVLALYAELDDRAVELKRASDYKSRFLSDISHELRTPLTSMQNLTRLLLEGADGTLNEEQTKQVAMIGRAAKGLAEMVNELLDLARIEAGKSTVRVSEFLLSDVFSSLRGMMRPLIPGDSVSLVIDDESADAIPALSTDEGRLSQILRNFLSNAAKFTVAGSIRLIARAEESDRVRIEVSDTGVGIAPEDIERIFDDFVQVDGPIQRRVRGTGLGLPLTRKLAALLGGVVSVESTLGAGSTFAVTIPITYNGLGSTTESNHG